MRLLAVLILSSALGGCTVVGSGSGGVVASPGGREGRTGAALNGRMVGAFGTTSGFVTGMGLRGKLTDEVKTVAPSVEAGFFGSAPKSPVQPYGMLGIHVIEVGSIDRRFAVGTMSPYLDVGAAIPIGFDISGDTHGVRLPFAFFLGASAEYAVRPGEAPSEHFVQATVGFGTFLQVY